ncbi:MULTISPECIES: hypothetical protein [unclassified Burkholderia]|uniref:hypothetical protein n=1 Tax=unclassified Burkholderia TaxID=2613784 RepID=UPI000F58C28F|nr:MULTISPECIES: hypothetical protein [unclassified Burkholderia]RQS08584.1 hypothetical protein DIE02_12050 [Burkholderia sp. Bp8991]RQS27285.1 hypothetical protein DIE05_18580 [Burkholderia sp. Bp8995]RQS45701.1 hypothetical protein DIE00_18400 [Burkholderia sp. Bp8989]
MKHRNDIRFATTGPASCRTGRLRAPGTQAGIASVVRVATAVCVVTRRSLLLRVVQRLLRLAMPLAGEPVAVIAIAIAIAALSAGTSAIAATAAALACASAARGAACAARRIAQARAAPAASSPARHRPFSSVRLTLMQDPSS